MKMTPKQLQYLRMREQRGRSMLFRLWIDGLWTQKVAGWGLLERIRASARLAAFASGEPSK